MKYIFTGGGTLGHTNPAVAVAEKIRKSDSDAKILFIMRNGGGENSIVVEKGFEITGIPCQGLIRNSSAKSILQTMVITVKAISKCIQIVKDYQPDLIFGTGGYVSFAPLIAGIIKGVPTYVHESNAIPGVVTKLTAKLGAIPLVSNENTQRCFKARQKCAVVGTPVTYNFNAIDRKTAKAKLGIPRGRMYIVSFGGSGGAKAMNDIITEIMQKRSCEYSSISHLHATGEKYYQEYKEKYPRLANGANGQQIVAKIQDMATHMAAADIIICRCGAATLAELAEAGRAAILIPSPNVTDNHQYKNAKALVEAKAALMIEEQNLSTQSLENKLTYLADSIRIRSQLEKNIKKFSKSDSADIIAAMLIKAAEHRLPGFFKRFHKE